MCMKHMTDFELIDRWGHLGEACKQIFLTVSQEYRERNTFTVQWIILNEAKVVLKNINLKSTLTLMKHDN